MLKWIESTGKTEEAAIEAALRTLGMDRDDVSVEVLERAKSGFLGIGSCPAKVKVTYEAPDEPEEAPKAPEAPAPQAPGGPPPQGGGAPPRPPGGAEAVPPRAGAPSRPGAPAGAGAPRPCGGRPRRRPRRGR